MLLLKQQKDGIYRVDVWKFLCSEGRIEGVQRIGGMWLIPEDSQKPADARIKTGKYIKSKKDGVQYG